MSEINNAQVHIQNPADGTFTASAVPPAAPFGAQINTGRMGASSAATQPYGFMSNILRYIGSTSGLSEEGRKFWEAIKPEVINKLQTTSPLDNHPIGVTVVSTDFPRDCHLFVAERTIVPVLFSESIPTNPDGLSKYTSIESDLNSFIASKAVNGETVVPAIMITPQDYNNVSSMARYIANIIRLHETGMDLQFTSMDPGSKFVVNFNRDSYRQAMRALSPFAVAPRSDVSFTLSFIYPDASGRPTTVDVGAVSLYTTFTRNPASQRYTAMVHISSIDALVTNKESIMLLILTAYLVGIRGSLWTNVYNNIGVGDKSVTVNLGNLLTQQSADPKVANTLFEATNQSEIQYVFQHFIDDSPALVLDYVNGRTNIPGLKELLTSPGAMLETFRKLVGNLSANDENDIIQYCNSSQSRGTIAFQGYGRNGSAAIGRQGAGYVQRGGTDVDLRYVDYLNLCVCNASQNVLEMFTNFQPDEATYNRAVDASNPQNYELIYANDIYMLDTVLLQKLSAYIESRIHNPNGMNTQGIPLDISGAVKYMSQHGQGVNNGYAYYCNPMGTNAMFTINPAQMNMRPQQ